MDKRSYFILFVGRRALMYKNKLIARERNRNSVGINEPINKENDFIWSDNIWTHSVAVWACRSEWIFCL